MPLNITPELKAHLGQTTTTLATCLEIILVDGSGIVYRFTDHDKPINFGGNIYTPTSGYISSASNTKIDLSVDNLKIVGIINDNEIKYGDLLAGRFDFAKTKIFQVNYNDLTMGNLTIIEGIIGKITLNDNSFTAELRSLTQYFQQSIGDVYTVLCSADLGDNKCKVNLAPFTKSFTVGGIVVGAERRIFITDLIDADNYFDLGLVTWDISSANEYFKMDVKRYLNNGNAGQIELYEPMPFDIQIGDTGLIRTGCDKTWETCRDRYTNHLNYRGYPFLYGLSTALRGKR